MNQMNDISLVGVLQDLGLPYALLFVDKDKRQLYLFVRESDDFQSSRFVAAMVSPDDVQSYMADERTLTDIFKSTKSFIALMNDDSITPVSNFNGCFNPRTISLNSFDPDLCDDEIWVETFLNRIKNNQPLEIA